VYSEGSWATVHLSYMINTGLVSCMCFWAGGWISYCGSPHLPKQREVIEQHRPLMWLSLPLALTDFTSTISFTTK